ncbi:hypothetical protein LSH36_281g04005 [Paralvinella palmiformis]|uniref:Uncharacterized protein n=1 Tax=Paralvinella palmiformis TaxID=53620 RepID=A0AAD9N1Q4_9ANNE|nr:hypothetical protein LSH36_281g04005 [Paralvinella palmiformis]
MNEYYSDPTDAEYLSQPDAQQAVHLNTIRKNIEGILAPRSSPTGDHNPAILAHNIALKSLNAKRLEELQQAMVGGEQANNEEVKERIRNKKKYAEERKRKLKEALAQQDGDDIMLGIFDSTQIDLVKQRKALEKQKQKNEALQQEIYDLQSEFEFDRIDYLDTIRKQDQQIKWLQAVIERIHPCLRRDSNYINLDRIKIQSQWDEDNQYWILPKMTLEKTVLPGVASGTGRQETQPRQNGEIQSNQYNDIQSEDRYLEKLNRNTGQDVAMEYFKSKRTAKLLRNGSPDKSRGNNSSPVTNGISLDSPNKPPTAWQSELASDAASVHRQLMMDETLTKKPMRLESLAPTKSSRRKKKQYTIEQL